MKLIKFKKQGRNDEYPCGLTYDGGITWLLTNNKDFLSTRPRPKNMKGFTCHIPIPAVINSYFIRGSVEYLIHFKYERPEEYQLVMTRELFDTVKGLKSDVSVKGISGPATMNIESVYYHVYGYAAVNVEMGEPNFFSIKDGNIYYSTMKDVGMYEELGEAFDGKRQTMKHSKFISLLEEYIECDELLKERAIEVFAERLKIQSTITVLVSADVDAIYKTPTSDIESGTLRNSCMAPGSSHDCKRYSDFYNKVGANIAYILDIYGNLSARAIMWNNVKIDSKMITFIDRIYGSERHIETIKKWARDNGYYHKISQTSGSYEITNGIDRTYLGEYDLNFFLFNKIKGAPYLDSLRLSDGYKLSARDGKYSLNSTCGGVGNWIFMKDYICRSCKDIIPDLSTSLIYNLSIYCDKCCVFSKITQDRIPKVIAKQDHNGDWFDRGRGDFVVAYDGLFYNISEIKMCHTCRKYYPKKMIVPHKGAYYCPECLEKKQAIDKENDLLGIPNIMGERFRIGDTVNVIGAKKKYQITGFDGKYALGNIAEGGYSIDALKILKNEEKEETKTEVQNVR
jgi:hypothetical protein